jgi:hypothetical protein
MACASAGFELPATSLIAPFLPDIFTKPSATHARRGHNKASVAGQYGRNSLSRSFCRSGRTGFSGTGRHCEERSDEAIQNSTKQLDCFAIAR